MTNMDFLKKQHFSMFEEKRDSHKKLVHALWRQYVLDKNLDKENKWLLFSGFYRFFSENFPAEVYDRELIVGTNWHWRWQDIDKTTAMPFNIGHFIPNHYDFLTKGINGKIKEIEQMSVDTDEKSTQKTGMITSLCAFSSYIKKYAKTAKEASLLLQSEDKERLLKISKDCDFIAENPPMSFRQALQFVWFVQSFLDTEAGDAAISFGRADDYLYPYYKNDIVKGILTREEALELIMCFYIKVSEGNESCMLTVGGEIENELTLLFMEAQTKLKMRQPSISLRVAKTTSKSVLDTAGNLVLAGAGMPAYFNDSVVINGLKTLGFSDESAQNYGIVGCYEPAPQGVFSNTVASFVNLYDSFDAFLEQEYDASSFENFLRDYKEFFEKYYKDTLLPRLSESANKDRNRVSPFASCLLNREKYLYGINMLGIGILIDSIYTIKKLVFDESYTTIEYLKEQADKDFEDISLYDRIKGIKNHYGSYSEESNRLAKDITKFIGKTIQVYSLGENIVSFPGLFRFAMDIHQRDYKGTINGRKKGELLSYGIMPCATPHKNELTSLLMSCANISSEYFPDGCPVMISMNKKDIQKDEILNTIIKTFFDAGGFHLAVNTVDAKLLEQAKQNPKEYADVMVKISGYSAQFTTLRENIQNAVIERATTE